MSDANARRNLLGCICTVENLTTGQRITWHIEGLRGAAARNVADRIDALGPDWRLVSYSTPLTILSDLRQAPMNGDARHPGRPAVPETMLFSRIERADVVHPRLLGEVVREGRRRGRLA